MNIADICNAILDEASSPEQLRDALDGFSATCSEVSGIRPNSSFSAWADDSLLHSGVAINPQAAAHCVRDYQRSVVFIRGVYAALCALKIRFAGAPLEILYAGCGPFATLLLPLLGRFPPSELNITLLDIHQRSLDSANLLLEHFGFSAHSVSTVRGDACFYKHPKKLQLVIAETMQKSLEQEPQFAVTANLAQQICPEGVFIPQRIDVSLCLADLEQEKNLYKEQNATSVKAPKNSARRHFITTLCTLSADNAAAQRQAAAHNSHTNVLELQPTSLEIPQLDNISRLNAALFTQIIVYQQYCLDDYQAEITLPARCHELEPLCGGERYTVSYQLGTYPKFHFELQECNE